MMLPLGTYRTVGFALEELENASKPAAPFATPSKGQFGRHIKQNVM